MKKILPFLLLLVSCGNNQQVDQGEVDSCDKMKYQLIWSTNTNDPVWKIQYLEYVGDCLEDTTLAKKLAELDAEQGNYNILIHGTNFPLCPFQNIHDQYPISFHTPVRVQSEIGEFYNKQVKKLIKRDLELDFDSLLEVELNNCFANDSIEIQ